jgi:hypothetical protein
MDSLTRILCFTHSGLRWLVVLAMLVALVWLLIGYLRQQAYSNGTRITMTVYSSAVGLQWLVGVVYFVVYGLNVGYRWGHAVLMTLALVVAHLHVMVKKRPDNTRYIFGIGSIILVGVLIWLGVASLPLAGWSFSQQCLAFQQ